MNPLEVIERIWNSVVKELASVLQVDDVDCQE